MIEKVRLSTGQSWSEIWPGFIHCGDQTYRKPFEWNGEIRNRYVLEKKCSQCGSLHLQDRNNARRSKNSFCSKECKANHINDERRGSKFIKKRTHGRGHHVLVKMPEHPRASRHGCVYEHILVAEETIGRPILPTERVHHINCVKNDNRPENLFVCSSDTQHFSIHGSLNDCVAELIEMGVLTFDHSSLSYKVIKK
jgi:endogenous inhibitor of DNA gyrase (YacG/DUF329 family)